MMTGLERMIDPTPNATRNMSVNSARRDAADRKSPTPGSATCVALPGVGCDDYGFAATDFWTGPLAAARVAGSTDAAYAESSTVCHLRPADHVVGSTPSRPCWLFWLPMNRPSPCATSRNVTALDAPRIAIQ